MDINLDLITEEKDYDITGTYKIPKEYYKGTIIEDLSPVKVIGHITIENEEYYIKCNIQGTMKIPDSIALDYVDYKYNIYYDDIILEEFKKSENILDILLFLWENIVLEVPLTFTEVKDYSKYKGDGWRLVREEDLTNNNPFNELLKDYEEE